DALTDRLQGGPGEDATLGDIGRGHVFQDIFGLQNAVAGDIDLADRRALQHGDVENVAFAGHLHFLEVLRGSDGADDLRGHVLVDLVTNADGQQPEYNTRGDSLQAIDLDIF